MKYRETRIETPRVPDWWEPEGESHPLVGTADVLGEYRVETKTLTVTRPITISSANERVFWDDRHTVQQYGSVRREAIESHEASVPSGAMKGPSLGSVPDRRDEAGSFFKYRAASAEVSSEARLRPCFSFDHSRNVGPGMNDR